MVTWAAPGARVSEGPMRLASGGEDWQEQAVDPDAATLSKGRGVSVADYDDDGRLDIFLPNLGPDQLYLGQGGGVWEDHTDPGWPAGLEFTTASVAVDFDDDGDIDLTAVNRGGANRLWENDGSGNFTRLEDIGWSETENGTTGASWADIDGDGDLDVLLFAHFEAPTPEWNPDAPGPADDSELYLNNGDGTFTDISYLIPEALHGAYTYAGGFHDLDQDGDPDMFFVNDLGSLREGNWLLRNDSVDGELIFTDASEETGLAMRIFGMGLAVGEINGDGLPDMVAASWDDLVLLESVPDGTWFNSAATRGVEAEYNLRDVAWGTQFADMDNDGREDLLVPFGYIREEHEGLGNPERQPDALFIQLEDGRFEQVAEDWGFDQDGMNRGLSTADLNGDGYLDVVKRDVVGDATIHTSRCGSAGWLMVRLAQPAPNVDAIGATVQLRAAGVTQTRWVRAGGTSYASSDPFEVHFGLGEAEMVDRILVTWPDGSKSVVEDVSARQRLEITRTPE